MKQEGIITPGVAPTLTSGYSVVNDDKGSFKETK